MSRHKLLARQIRRLLGEVEEDRAVGANQLDAFLDAVDDAYHQADRDHALLERSLELTSNELLEQNRRLRAEVSERAAIQERLQQELTRRRETEESLRRSLVRLDEAQRVARLGHWEIDLQDGSVFWSDQIYRIHGFEPGEVVPTTALFLEMVSEETAEQIANLIRTTGHSGVREFVFPLTRADGEVRMVRASGEVVRDAEGHVRHIYGVCADVTEDEERRAELVRARERAEDMLRLKTAFLNNMSHELRTPLTGIIGYADLLADEIDDEYRDFVDAIVRGGRRLMGTLNSVLDLAQLESGTFQLLTVPLDLQAEIEEALTILRPLAIQKNLRLTLAGDATPTWALVDRAALFRVLNNLIGNAIKFTEQGAVEVSAGVAPEGRAFIRISDTGPGIGPEFLPRLFEAFRQESDGFDRRHEGNGLGLAITQHLVTLMDGAIEVESDLGEGATFTVFFPAAPVEETPAWRSVTADA